VREGLVRLSEDVHALSYRLHPSILADLGLIEALKVECEQFSKITSIGPVINTMELPSKLPQDISLCLFRITQEALRNIARHAGASRTEVSLGWLHGGLKLAVTDNGVGFDSGRLRIKMSLGHASMRQRAVQLGGKIEIDSKPGLGTIVVVWIPFVEKRVESPSRVAG